jgi:hypothetical protein
MLQRLLIPALILVSGAAWAQSAPETSKSGQSTRDPGLSTQEDEAIQQVPQKLREKLTADGYSDVKIAPGSYIVSARDKNGNRVVMTIGPTSMTMMKVPDQNPSQAQVPSDKDEIIPQ